MFYGCFSGLDSPGPAPGCGRASGRLGGFAQKRPSAGRYRSPCGRIGRGSVRVLALFVWVALVRLVLCPALAKAADGPATDGKKEPATCWKWATLTPEGVGWSQHIKRLLFPMIQEETGGDLTIKVYWGGAMGDEKDYIEKMRDGRLEGAGLSGQGTIMAVPEMSVLELPFMFNGYDEVDHVRKHMTEDFDKYMKEHDFFMIAWLDQGFDQMFSRNEMADTIQDWRDTRFLSWYGQVEEDTFEALGIPPITVNVPEMAASVRQGMGDAIISPAVWVVGAQLYPVFKTVVPLKIRYSPSVLVCPARVWEGFPELEPYRRIFLERRDDVIAEYCRLIRRDNAKCLEGMIQYGLRPVALSPTELQKARVLTRPVWDEQAGRLYPEELLDTLVGHLEDFRSRPAGETPE